MFDLLFALSFFGVELINLTAVVANALDGALVILIDIVSCNLDFGRLLGIFRLK